MGERHRDPFCLRARHERRGIVTSGGPEGAHAATDVCDRPECIEDAIGWAQAITREPATHIPDRAPAERQQATRQAAVKRPVVEHRDGIVWPTKPFVRPDGSDEPVPPGWIAEPTMQWNGKDAEVVYDPRRHEVLRIAKSRPVRLRGDPTATSATEHSDQTLRRLTPQGWEQIDQDSDSHLLVRDRVGLARRALDRAGRTPGVEIGGAER